MTNKLISILLLTFFLPLTIWSQKVPSKKIVETFLKSKTYIVYDVSMFSSYNFYVKDAIENNWTITEYEFISYNEFIQKRKQKNSSFLVLTDVTFNNDKTATVYNFLSLILGGNYRFVSDMPDIVNIPLSISGQDEDLYMYKIPAIIGFIQKHALLLKMKPELASKPVEEVYKITDSGFAGKTFYFIKEDLAPEINSITKIKEVFPFAVKILAREEIEEAINKKVKNIIFLHKVGSDSKQGNRQCFTVLIGADDYEIYYFNHHTITRKNGNYLQKKDLIKLAKKI